MTAAPLSTLAARFRLELERVADGKARVQLPAFSAAFAAAAPELATSTERRARLALAIDELVAAQVARASRQRDDGRELPKLPKFLTLVDGGGRDPVSREARAFPWRPELTFAAKLPLRRSEVDALKAIQAFLRDRGARAPVVPLAERSLEIFGDEKKLDSLRQNRRLFSEGRLSVEILKTRAVAPPFVYRHTGAGDVALVVENAATYHSVIATLPSVSPVGLVVFGGGGAFSASVAYFAEVLSAPSAPRIRHIRYFGDLDKRGLEIPVAADALASTLGLPRILPAVGLWALLLAHGRRAAYPAVERASADALGLWLPEPLREPAAEVLASGVRLAQEAVGTELLASESVWCTWAGLGPPGLSRPRDVSKRKPEARLVERSSIEQEGELRVVDGRNTRHALLDDPILDWLDLFGRQVGFVSDTSRPDYDRRTDLRAALGEKALAFRHRVAELLAERARLVHIARDGTPADRHKETLAALRSAVPVVVDGHVLDEIGGVTNDVHFLARSDLLARWFPELLSMKDAAAGAPALGLPSFHYRVVNAHFATVAVRADGHLALQGVAVARAGRAWLASRALARAQGTDGLTSYLLGRRWSRGELVGEGCFDRVGRVEVDAVSSQGIPLATLCDDAVRWRRRVELDGASWQVLPTPSAEELYPNMKNDDDAGWRRAKKEIARSLRELTLLPSVGTATRRRAHAAGIVSHDDPALLTTGILEPSPQLVATIAAQRAPAPTVLPLRIERSSAWRQQAPLEFFVDVEHVNNIADDLSRMPLMNDASFVVQIGCGELRDGAWRFEQWTVEALTAAESDRVVEAWRSHVQRRCAEEGVPLSASRIVHWSSAEPSSLTAADSSNAVHGSAWLDLLDVFRTEPIGVTGAFSFALKEVAGAMRSHGFLPARNSQRLADGESAIAAVLTANEECAGRALSTHPLIAALAAYNEEDCRLLSDLLTWLRRER